MRLRDRNPIYICWRVAAIRRCVDRKGMSRDWALSKLREIAPDGSRDQMLTTWFPTFEASSGPRGRIGERRLLPGDIAPAPRARTGQDKRVQDHIAA